MIECAAQDGRQQAVQTVLEGARLARLAGDQATARCAIERVVSAEPQNADAWVQLGFVHSASGDEARARAAFLRALDISPDYDDAKFGLAQLAYRSGDVEGARVWLHRMDLTRRGDPDVDALRRSLSASQAGLWGWDAVAAYSSLSQGLAPWREASWSVSRREATGSLGASLEYAQRFDLSDVFGEVRFARIIQGATWGVALGGASQAHFRPEAAARLEFATREDHDWAFNGAMTLARYGVGQIDQLSLRAFHNLDGSLRVHTLGVVVHDEVGEIRTGYGLGAAQRLNGNIELSFAWSDAPESSAGATIDVRSVALGVAADIMPNLRVRVGVLREERGAFNRSELSFAMTRTF